MRNGVLFHETTVSSSIFPGPDDDDDGGRSVGMNGKLNGIKGSIFASAYIFQSPTRPRGNRRQSMVCCEQKWNGVFRYIYTFIVWMAGECKTASSQCNFYAPVCEIRLWATFFKGCYLLHFFHTWPLRKFYGFGTFMWHINLMYEWLPWIISPEVKSIKSSRTSVWYNGRKWQWFANYFLLKRGDCHIRGFTSRSWVIADCR